MSSYSSIDLEAVFQSQFHDASSYGIVCAPEEGAIVQRVHKVCSRRATVQAKIQVGSVVGIERCQGVIQEVEGSETELEGLSFSDLKILVGRKIIAHIGRCVYIGPPDGPVGEDC